MSSQLDRRDFLKRSLVGSAAGITALSLEEQVLLAQLQKGPALVEPARPLGSLPTGRIGKLKVTRLIVGGNLTSGNAHSRDLIYVSSLLRQYFTNAKIFETWDLCEQCGINTAILRLDDHVIGLLTRYWNERGGKLQWIVQIKPATRDLAAFRADIRRAVDSGAVGAYIQGNVSDNLVKDGQIDLLGEVLRCIKDAGVVAGIGAHDLQVPVACENAGLKPDFYMKTLHSRNYGSFNPARRQVGALPCGRPEGHRERLVYPTAGNDRVHAKCHDPVDRIQGPRGRCHCPAGGLPARLRERRRLHLRRHVRLSGPRRHDHRSQDPERQADPPASLAGVKTSTPGLSGWHRHIDNSRAARYPVLQVGDSETVVLAWADAHAEDTGYGYTART